MRRDIDSISEADSNGTPPRAGSTSASTPRRRLGMLCVLLVLGVALAVVWSFSRGSRREELSPVVKQAVEQSSRESGQATESPGSTQSNQAAQPSFTRAAKPAGGVGSAGSGGGTGK